MGLSNNEGEMELPTDVPPKPTWEQVVAMQRESAALRAQAAAVLPTVPSAAPPRPRRPPPRNEYPVFAPSYNRDPLFSGISQMQDLVKSGRIISFRGRPEEQHHRGNPEEEILPAEPSTSMNSSHALSGHRNGLRSPHTPSNGLTPSPLQAAGFTPTSIMSRKSHKDAPITPSSIPSAAHSQVLFSRNPAHHRAGSSLRGNREGPVLVSADVGSRGNGMNSDTANSAQTTSWKGCSGSLAMVAPFGDSATGAGSAMNSPRVMKRLQVQQPADRSGATQAGGLFGFLPWGKKVSKMGDAAPDSRMNYSDKESHKSLESKIQNLQHKLEQTQKKRASEVGELQVALQSLEEKFKHLQLHCQNLELQLSQVRYAGASLQDTDEEEDEGSSSGESQDAMDALRTGLPDPDLTPAAFVRAFEEAVVHIKNLARAICHHIREMGESASHVITALLGNHSVAKGRMPKAVKNLYFVSFLNQVMFENFENVNFEANGATAILDPEALRHVNFHAFQELREVTWSDIEERLDEQGVIVSPSFHQFFVVRMEVVLHQLGDVGETSMPGTVISAFFEAIKAVWLLHHLAFSFRPAATILRVAQGARLDTRYMEPVVLSDKDLRGAGVVLMVNPGFLLYNRVVKCKVFCSSKYS